MYGFLCVKPYVVQRIFSAPRTFCTPSPNAVDSRLATTCDRRASLCSTRLTAAFGDGSIPFYGGENAHFGRDGGFTGWATSRRQALRQDF